MGQAQDEIVKKAVAFLSNVQQADGRFLSYSSSKERPFIAEKTYCTTFGPSLILAALAGASKASAICARLALWLADQRSDGWSFNYWAHAAPERQTLPYPDDLDDTFCALIALHRQEPDRTNEAVLGCVVRLLVAAESRVGGPYETWLVPKEAKRVWHDVDLAVNSNIAYFLGLVGTRLPQVDALLQTAVISGMFASPYYPSEYSILYYVSRAYAGPDKTRLIAHILAKRQNGHWPSVLATALSITSLHALGSVDAQSEARQYLCDMQLPDGSWPAEAFCLDPSRKGQAYFSGSSALTTALVLEALTHSTTPEPARVSAVEAMPDTHEAQLIERIAVAAEQSCAAFDPELRYATIRHLRAIQKSKHSREITLLPYLFARSLTEPPSFSDDVLVRLGLANLYGWLAYTIFDDFLDDEGRPQDVPVACAALRQSLHLFEDALPDASFRKYARQTFDHIDAANAWEAAHCRFQVDTQHITIAKLPSYHRSNHLYQRSLGHTLTPLAVLVAQGYSLDEPAVIACKQALQHYLAARQLNDDLHDWEEDVSRGHSSYVVTAILANLHIPLGKQPLKSLVARMRRQFWHHTLLAVCEDADRHIRLARRYLKQSNLLQDENSVTGLLDGLDASVARTRSEQSKAEAFLAAYQGENKS